MVKGISQGFIVSALAGSSMLLMGSAAAALTTPDTGSCTSTATNGCLRITNTSTGNGRSITAQSSGSGTTITSVANSGSAVSATSTSGNAIATTLTLGGTGAAALQATVNSGSNGGFAIRATSRPDVSGTTAILAERVNTSGTLLGTGVAIMARGGGWGIDTQGWSTGVYASVINPNSGWATIVGDAQNSSIVWAADFIGDVNVSGGYYVNGSFVASDARLKKDVHDLKYGLKELMKLRAVSYRMKEGRDDVRLGVIAQEIQKVLPELVTTNRKTGMYAVDYSGIIPVAINAVQQQEATIEQQAKLIERLDARISALESAKKPLAATGLGTSAAAALALLPLGLLLSRRRDQRKRSDES